MKQIDRMGVFILVAHLLVTLSLIATYIIFAYFGKSVTTIENMLLIVVGYWFGQYAIGKQPQQQEPPQSAVIQTPKDTTIIVSDQPDQTKGV